VLFDEHGGVELVGPLAGTFSITVPAAAAGEAA
jgi:hypothetical protein